MSDNKNDQKDFEGLGKLLDHNYDNIRELDNPLPGWWLVTFYGTIIFGIIYFGYYQLFGGPNLDQELQTAMTEIRSQLQAQAPAPGPQVDLKALYADDGAKTKGKAVYDLRCVACHGPKGEGVIGPNLTDDFWIHGDGSLEAIHTTVSKGVLEKGMPAWESQITAEEVNNVTVYVRSLRGTNPPNPKAPQGDKKEVVL
jgi:cytochrome c oxidase cbb3-type subunit 3